MGDSGADSQFDLTVVVPTYNRANQLRRTIMALGDQDAVSGTGQSFTYEIVVVSDGSTDGTADMVRRIRLAVPLRLIERDNGGPGAARNSGVEAARGRIVVFIDDDVVADRRCLAAHFDRHRSRDDLVVIGPMLTPSDTRQSLWVAWEQRQLYKQYDAFARYDYPAHHRQLYTGNASVARQALIAVGGFDTTLKRAEDVELGHRLHGAGCSFVFDPTARAHHYAERSFESWFRTAFEYGRNDVRFAAAGQPEITERLSVDYHRRSILTRRLVRVLLPRPRAADAASTVLRRGALAADALGLRRLGLLLLSPLYNMHFYRGVADGLGSDRRALDLLERGSVDTDVRALLILEQTLGHITHTKNLRSLTAGMPGLAAEFLPVTYEVTGLARRVPGWSNWTVRAGLRARAGLIRRYRWPGPRPDVLFVHTQVPAVLLGSWMRRIPTIVSLDATPMQYDELGDFYQHDTSAAWVERAKKALNRRSLSRAAHVVTWSDWARQGVIDEYGVEPAKVTVIAPGVDLERWSTNEVQNGCDPLRILFVGADLERKGGDHLLTAVRRLRSDPTMPEFEVDLVTAADVGHEPGVTAHHGLVANSAELVELYHRADIFCLPTLGDCLPMVLAEAGAAGLPLVSSRVGAISELVIDGVTGRLVPPGDVDELTSALRDLLLDPVLRRECGRRARELVLEMHDARRNTEKIRDLLRDAADGRLGNCQYQGPDANG